MKRRGARVHLYLFLAHEDSMPLYRVTIRFGAPKQQYHMEDIDANSLREALRLAAERFPDAALASADLAEVRRQVDPEERSFTPE
jgi:hypothetical protein